MASIVLTGRVAPAGRGASGGRAREGRGAGGGRWSRAARARAWWAGSVLFALVAAAYAIAVAFGLPVRALRMAQEPALAFGVDLALLLAFTLHFHFVQRPGARCALWLVTPSAPRTAVALLQAAVLVLLAFGLWQPLAQAAWLVESPVAAGWLWTGYAMGWTLLLWGERDPEVIVAGICLVEWCVPEMTLGHLLFAIALTAFALRYRRALAALAAG